MTRGRPFIDGRPSKLTVLCPDVCGVGWDFRMGGVAEAASRLWNGMRFPVGGSVETASHFASEFWDTVFRGLWAANYMRLS